MKHKLILSITSAILLSVCATSNATVMPSASTLCPLPDKMKIVPELNHNHHNPSPTGRWQGQNVDGNHFESQTAYPTSGTIASLNPGKTEVIDNYKIKCAYSANDPAGSIYSVILYNEHDYQLCPNNKIVGANESCDD